MSLTKIASVDPHSPARKAGVRPGETLTHINGHPIVDVLDYKFYAYDPRLELTLTEENGGSRVCLKAYSRSIEKESRESNGA